MAWIADCYVLLVKISHACVQGYHDVGSVFLLTLGDQRAFEVFQQVSESYHREPMGAGFEIVMQTTRLLFPLLNAEDSELHAYIRESGVRFGAFLFAQCLGDTSLPATGLCVA